MAHASAIRALGSCGAWILNGRRLAVAFCGVCFAVVFYKRPPQKTTAYTKDHRPPPNCHRVIALKTPSLFIGPPVLAVH